MKYIDAEKLISEIERRKKGLFEIGGDTFETRWACGSLDTIKAFVISFQQEQPSLFSNLDEAAEEYALDVKAKPYGNLVKDAFKGGVKWHDAKILKLPNNMDEAAIDAAQLDMQDRQIMEATNDERLRYSRIFRRGFKAGAEWMASLVERPEVDLEKESVMFCFDNGINISPRQAKNIASHFWNKGYNARKED